LRRRARGVTDAVTPPRVSIIVPVLNEAAGIATALAPLQPWRRTGAEVLVVDGGSDDDTPRLAAAWCDRVIEAPRGRARQMNAGAAAARGALLLFLHADTRLPADAPAVLSALPTHGPLWGRFDVRIDGRDPLLPIVACLMNWRSRLTRVATGDQAMFVTRELFARSGGFPDIELMEDVALSKRLRRVSAPVNLRQRVTTSGRRWVQGGTLRTVLLMWGLRLGYVLGVTPATLARWYRHAR